MARFWTFVLLAFVPLVGGLALAGAEKDYQAKGKFTKDDPKDQQRGGPSQVHTVKMKAGKAYTIDMMSSEFDSYLRLLDPKGKQLAEDDDGGDGLNARIIFNCTMDGDYKIVCTTFGANVKGENYTLTVKATGGVQALASAHAGMIGKEAPDFTGNFALNGKPAWISDLKGKVVLVNFWDVRSSTSVALLKKLGEWNKAHKKAGLVIVGATFYPSDIDQKLGFDEESGEIKTAAQADRKSDQALLRAFAKHHKIDHMLTALPKDDALNVFNAYVVNGYPQLVLIDRKGMVRMIDVNGEKNVVNVENEIKKLLAEK
jgi:hypothetical protein